jgi:hypothetical protein
MTPLGIECDKRRAGDMHTPPGGNLVHQMDRLLAGLLG